MKTRFDGHTPGPWMCSAGHFIEGATGHDVGEVVYMSSTDAEDDANGQLMAAAPDLLRVACELAEALEHIYIRPVHFQDDALGQCLGCGRVMYPELRDHAVNCKVAPALAFFHTLVDPRETK